MLTAVGPGTGKRGGGTSERAGAGGLYGTCAACLPGAAEMPTGSSAVAGGHAWTMDQLPHGHGHGRTGLATVQATQGS